MFVKKQLFFGGQNSSRVLVVLELKYPKRWAERRHMLVLMLENGHCVVLGSPSPIVMYYPSWAGIEFFTGTTLDEYDANHPEAYELPEEWNTEEVPLGPPR